MGSSSLTHLSEERDIPVDAQKLWSIVADTKMWPRFYASPRELLHLRAVEYLDGAKEDGLGVKRRMHILGLPSWDEECTSSREPEWLVWKGIRNPGLSSWQQQLELVPGKGSTTLRWDIYYKVNGPHPLGKLFKRTFEDLMLASLERVEKVALESAPS